jgi:hypothetical protein
LKVSADDSDWLAAEQARKRRIKIYAIIGVVIVSSCSPGKVRQLTNRSPW